MSALVGLSSGGAVLRFAGFGGGGGDVRIYFTVPMPLLECLIRISVSNDTIFGFVGAYSNNSWVPLQFIRKTLSSSRVIRNPPTHSTHS